MPAIAGAALFGCVGAVAQGSAGGESAGSSEFAGRVLAMHNSARSAVAVEPLRWNDTLARQASDWAGRLAMQGRLEHAPASRAGSGHGENLWIGTRGAFDPEEMVQHWLDEQRHIRPGQAVQTGKGGNLASVGHYTQMVWRGTRQVGCGIGRGPRYDVLVCRYDPPGNLIGSSAY